MSAPKLAQRNHEFAPDDSGYSCMECPLPKANRIHRTDMPDAAPLPRASARPVEKATPDDGRLAEKVRQCMTASRQPSMRAAMFRAIAGVRHGLTDDELMLTAFLQEAPPNSVRPRRVELMQDGLIEASGMRQTATGTPATVWVLSGAVRDLANRGVVDL